MRCREPPHQCLPQRMKGPFRRATSAALALSIVPCALGLQFSTSATCSSHESSWHYGLSCYLLKIGWALSLLMMCVSLYGDHVVANLYSCLIVVFLLPLRTAIATAVLPPVKKESDAESTSSFEKPEQQWPPQLYVNFDRPSTLEQQRWLQRRNSLSSQKAIYPYAFEPRRSATYSMGYGYSPGSHYSFQRNTMRSFSDSQPTLCDPHRSYSSSSGSRPVTALSSSGSMYSRRYHQLDPNCPAIPESPKQSIDKTPKKAADGPPAIPAPPPPAWCPPLQHAPLSSDPAIRALTGSPAGQLKTLASSTISSTYTPSAGFLSRTTTANTTVTPSLSRATTTQTSILNVSRPSTASTPSSRSISATSSTTSLKSSRSHSPPPPLPPLPPAPNHPPPAIPRRATGHALSQARIQTLSSYGSGTATIRTLRRPEMIGVRSHQGTPKQKAGVWTYGGTADRSAMSSTQANARRYTPSNYSVASSPWATPTISERPPTGVNPRMI